MSSRLKSRLVRLERAGTTGAWGVIGFEFLSGPIVKRLPREYRGERHLEAVNQRPESLPGEDNCEFVERPGPEPPTTGPRVHRFCFIRPGEGR
jgi:hypothetical protein